MSTPPATPLLAPCVWLDDEAEEAAAFYTDLFPDSEVRTISRYPEGMDNPSGKPRGSVLTVDLDLAGSRLTLLNGGPHFEPNPSVSFFVHLADPAEVDRLAASLGEGGAFLMPLDTYPWSERYAWVQDRFGVSWQLMATPEAATLGTIAPALLFHGANQGRAEEALGLYAKAFPGGTIELLDPYGEGEDGPAGTLRYGRAVLADTRLVAMDSPIGHEFAFNEALSLQILCKDQAQVDHFWEALSEGGEEGPCGWLKDRFGVSWQVVPIRFLELLEEGPGRGYDRAFAAMLEMGKLDLAALERAYEGR